MNLNDTVQSPDPHFRYGYAVIDGSGKAIHQEGDVGAVFPLASVTKLFTAMGVFAAIEGGALALDSPAGPQGSTIAHLLSHASGLAPEGSGNDVVARVGARRIYSNQGYEELGRQLERATGNNVSQWLDSHLFSPLGMAHTRLEGSPAHGAVSSVLELALLAQELMDPQVLSPASIRAMRTPMFPALKGVLPGYGSQAVNLWGLGPEIKDGKDPHWTPRLSGAETFGHFGQSGSFLWVDPAANRAGVFLGEEPFGTWHRDNWPNLIVP